MMTTNESEILQIIRNVTERSDPEISEETQSLLEAVFRYIVAQK